jgi:hypothetical protein
LNPKEVTVKETIRLDWAALPLILATAWTVQQGVLQLTTPTPVLARNNRPGAGKTTAAAVATANAFLATLTDSQRTAVEFAFTDTAQRARWSNLPAGIFQRNGIKRGDMTTAQLAALDKLLATVLSPEGYQKVVNIMTADEVLKTGGGGGPGGPRGGFGPPGGPPGGGPPGGFGPGGGGPGRFRSGGGPAGGGRGGPGFGKAEYYVSFLGTPSTTNPWILQYGGHHLGLNITFVGTRSALTPSHIGTQPATFSLHGETVRPLGHENDKGFALINALDASQKAKAILSYRVTNLVLGPGRDNETIQPEGIKGSELTADQRAMLLDLASEWINVINAEAARPKLAEVKAHLADTYFAWSGPTTNGSVVYFRIQGPTVFIEFAHQMDSPNHIHTIYRDFTNEYGSQWITR